MVMAMMCGPPDRTTLHGRGPEQPEYELAGPRSLESAMRKVAVIKAGDGEHAHDVSGHRYGDRHRADAGPERGQARQVHQQEWNAARPINSIRELRSRQLE